MTWSQALGSPIICTLRHWVNSCQHPAQNLCSQQPNSSTTSAAIGSDGQNLVSDCPTSTQDQPQKAMLSNHSHTDAPSSSCLPAPRLMAPMGALSLPFLCRDNLSLIYLPRSLRPTLTTASSCPFTLAGLCSHPQPCPKISTTPGPLHCCPWHGRASS